MKNSFNKKTFLKWSNFYRKVVSDFDLNERFKSKGVDGVGGLRGPGVQGSWSSQMGKQFFKTFMKWPNYYRNVVSDFDLNERLRDVGVQGFRRFRGFRGSGVLQRPN